ncbi:hypothetical protein [Streptomyces variabilis]
MQQTRARMKTAVRPTGKTHPLLADAVLKTAARADQIVTEPAAFEPLAGIASADAAHTNEDVARTRQYLTVEQAAHMSSVADQLAAEKAAIESADRYIGREFPAVAQLLADEPAREHPAGLLAEDRARDANLAFSRALDAIEAALQASQDLDLTRRGLLAAVDAYTDEARRP